MGKRRLTEGKRPAPGTYPALPDFFELALSKTPLHRQGSQNIDSDNQLTSPGWMHETSAQGWCTGKTQRNGMEREAGGGIRMGNTCKSMAVSCQCMAKTTTIL